jgi:carbamoyltransferase
MDFFDYATGLTMYNAKRWERLFGIPPRKMESDLASEYMDFALAIQQVTEDIMLRLAQTAHKITGSHNLVLAGGVALNCVSNGKLLRKKLFDDIWIQPAAGDAGGALGAAYAAWHIHENKARHTDEECQDAMQGAYLGPEFSVLDTQRTARKYAAPYRSYDNFSRLCADVAAQMADGKVVGWFQGRMEYGPRALGNRSIVGDPRNPEMQKVLNLKIKYREGFRPFAPSVMEEDIQTYFDLECATPYMLLVAPVNADRRNPLPEGDAELDLYTRLYHLRSDIPAITHVDYSARIQSVSKATNPRYWELIDAFKTVTGYGVIVNTSFNVRGEPIVRTPEDAFRCFMRTEMDYLVIGNLLFDKKEQQALKDDMNWRDEYELD